MKLRPIIKNKQRKCLNLRSKAFWIAFLVGVVLMFIFLPKISAESINIDSLEKIDTKISINPFGYKKIIYEPVTKDKIVSDNFMLEEESFNYPIIRISKSLFWVTTDKIAEYKLIDSGNSLINSWTKGKAVLYQSGKLFDNAEFTDKSNKNYEIEYNYFIKKNVEHFKQVPIYSKEQVCEEQINEINKSLEQNCYYPIEKYENESYFVEEWVKYNFEILEPGNYVWKIEAKKPINKVIDFIPTAQSTKLDEYVWWDNSWEYKRQISLTENSGSTLTDYSTLIYVPYDDDMQSDFDDLRFTNSAEDTELGYWIENKSDGSYAYVWIKVPSLTASSVTDIYMYYGNSEVS